MLAWISFITVPLLLGAGMLHVKNLGLKEKTTAWILIFCNTALLTFLLVALYQFGAMYQRVMFYEFITGCGISIVVQTIVNNWNRGR